MTHNAPQYWITHMTNYTNLCHTEGVSHLSNTFTLLACHFSLCGKGVEEDNTSTSVLALSTASLPVATSLSTPLDDDNSVLIVPSRGVEVLFELPASTVGSCCCWSAGGASTLAGSSGLGYIYIDQPTRTQGSMQLRLLVSRAPGSYVEVTSALLETTALLLCPGTAVLSVPELAGSCSGLGGSVCLSLLPSPWPKQR